MSRHLSEGAIEALAHGRAELVDEFERLHARECGACAALVAETEGLSASLSRAMVDISLPAMDLDAMVAEALTHVTPALVPQREVFRPSNRAATFAMACGTGLALLLGAFTVKTSPVVLRAFRAVGTLFDIVDRFVMVLPGGWGTVALFGMFLLGFLALPLWRVARLKRLDVVSHATSVGAALLVVGILCGAGRAQAQSWEGDWDNSPKVSVQAEDRPASEVLGEIAEESGFGVVYASSVDPSVSMQVHGAPLRDVLALVFEGQNVLIRRQGETIVVRDATRASAATGAVPAVAPVPAAPPVPPVPAVMAIEIEKRVADAEERAQRVQEEAHKRMIRVEKRRRHEWVQKDGDKAPSRIVFGNNVHVGKDEVVGDVVTFGGNVGVEGEVVGDIATFGGNVRIYPSGTVLGEVVLLGGNITVDEGAEMPNVAPNPGEEELDIEFHEAEEEAELEGLALEERIEAKLKRFGETMERRMAVRSEQEGPIGSFFGSLAVYLLVFFFGIVAMALMPDRFDALRRTLVREPARAGLAGLLSLLVSAVAGLVLIITIIGIPAALALGVGFSLAVYAGWVAVASVIGAALPVQGLRGKPLLQFASGVGVLFAISFVPVVGGLLSAAAWFVGLGAVVMTRFGRNAVGDVV